MTFPNWPRQSLGHTLVASVALLAVFAGASRVAAEEEEVTSWRAHDLQRPRPKVVSPGEPMLPLAPPGDAIVLFDGNDLDAWQSPTGSAPGWRIRDGAMESVPGSGYVFSRQRFGDVQLHVEWAAPTPPEGAGQGRGNSGVYLMGKYEVQVLDSFQNETYADGQAGAIYGQYPPLVNVCRPPGAWQSFDIIFRRPRFKPDGRLQSPARMTVLHNGVLVQDCRELLGPTQWLKHDDYAPHEEKLPLALQDHGNPVRFRNIWLRELSEAPPPRPDPAAMQAPVELSHEQLQRYVGTYRTVDGQTYALKILGGKLQLVLFGRDFELIPHSPTQFSLKTTAAEVTCELDDSGTPAAVTFHMEGSDTPAKRSLDDTRD